MLHVCAFLLLQGALLSTAIAQTATTTTPDPAVPAADSGFGLLWLVVIVVLIAAAAWYFMRRRSAAGAPPKTGVYDRDQR
ncbi:MAG TPA: hypothetical protein VFS03_09715 [Microvirga sp.]|jgi:hypothetical protein|nr:hypothetical protein [Microvirga sp.]